MKIPGTHFSVPQLLTGMIALGGLTLGIVAFDAERLISAVDDLKTAQAQDHYQVTQNTGQIAALGNRVEDIDTKYVDLDHRVVKLEPR